MMQRRHFIKAASATTVFMGTGLHTLAAMGNTMTSQTPDGSKRLTILHTNDTHSHIEPIDGGLNKGRGGVARRKALIDRIRKESPNTLLLDCGDIFQGTPYFNFYGGELEIKLMSMMGYDACTIGNHDFDAGIDGLYKQLPHADFPFIISNYDFSNTVMDGRTKPYLIKELDGLRIGIFGLGIQLEGLVDQRLYKETAYLPPLDVAQELSRKLKNEESCDLVICLSHLGYQYQYDKIDDLTIAEKTDAIDLILGGHTHTFLDKPTKVTNAAGGTTLVNQVGCYGINLGRLDYYFGESAGEARETVYEI